MTKLEAWKAWSSISGVGGDEFTLEKSSHGKAFSYAWEAAVSECASIAQHHAVDPEDEYVCNKIERDILKRGSND